MLTRAPFPLVLAPLALLAAVQPDWTPAESQSALMTTAYTDVTDSDGTEADWLDMGSGRIDLTKAAMAGVVLDETEDVRHELTDVRLLLARSLYHSAQLDGTIRVATELLEHDPNEPYAHLLVGRALQRKGRRDEAQPHLRLAELLGGYQV